MNSPLGFSRIVTSFGHLRQLTEKARKLAELGTTLRAALPPAIAPHVRLATVTDGCLVLQAASPVWAAQLRFKTPEILANLRRNAAFADVRSIRIRNDLGAVEPTTSPVRPLRMSRDSAAALRAQADTIADPALRAALERLARRGSD